MVCRRTQNNPNILKSDHRKTAATINYLLGEHHLTCPQWAKLTFVQPG